MKILTVNSYADVIRNNCLAMVNSALTQRNFSTKFTLNVDLKEVIPELKGKAHVVFSPTAYVKVHDLVMSNDKEVACNGTVYRGPQNPDGERYYFVQDIFVYPQEATGATVESADEYGFWQSQLPDEVFNHLRFQMHSHVKMGVSPSGTDEAYYKRMLEQVQDFYIFMIMNQRHELWCEVYDVEANVLYENLDIIPDVQFENGSLVSEFSAHAKTMVKTKVYTPPATGYSYTAPKAAQTPGEKSAAEREKKSGDDLPRTPTAAELQRLQEEEFSWGHVGRFDT